MPPGLYIHDDSHRNVLLCGRSRDDTNCASFKFLGKQPTKMSLRLPTFLETDASFVPALTSSHGLEGRAGPIEIWSCKIQSLADQNPRLRFAEQSSDDSDSDQLITQIQKKKTTAELYQAYVCGILHAAKPLSAENQLDLRQLQARSQAVAARAVLERS